MKRRGQMCASCSHRESGLVRVGDVVAQCREAWPREPAAVIRVSIGFIFLKFVGFLLSDVSPLNLAWFLPVSHSSCPHTTPAADNALRYPMSAATSAFSNWRDRLPLWHSDYWDLSQKLGKLIS